MALSACASDQWFLATVGRMNSPSAIRGVIAAIPDLVRRGDDAVYLITADDRDRLEQLAREASLGERVQLRGAVGARRLAEAYRTADLFVMPSTGEGFEITFLEAMASGTPALGIDVAGARDALVDGELGTAILERDDLPTAVARLLAIARRDPDILSRAVRPRFGRDLFRVQVGSAVGRRRQPA